MGDCRSSRRQAADQASRLVSHHSARAPRRRSRSKARPALLTIFADGQEVAMLVNGGFRGHLDSTDSIEFFATPLDTPETATHAYYLIFGAQPGHRIAGVSGLPDKPGAAQSFVYTTELKPRFLYFPSIKNGDADNWFGPIISSTPYTLSLKV